MDIAMRAAIAFVAAAAGMFLSIKVVREMMFGNRAIEWKDDEHEPAPGRNAMNWAVIHIRDDIGSLCGVASLTNALIAAVLALLVAG